MNDGETHVSLEPIAIIGMAGRFPGAKNVDQFWRNLRDGVESVSFFTDEELVAEGVDRSLLSEPNYVGANAVLDDVEMFDASFFGFTPREAEITDPQHRLFLECAWELLETAGYEPTSYNGRIGVYAGAGLSTYLLNNLGPNRDLIKSVTDFQIMMGNNKDYVPTRVSYKLNLKGPSINVNTACSTSLVAVHIACQSLLDYHCDMALAGGVGIQVPQRQGYLYEEGGIASPDGHCRAFDARAQGTVSGSGVGIVLLKRLEDALADGDCIRAIIRGSAINNDGSSKVGYTAPSVEGQAEVIAEAQAVAGIEPDTITYIETHGTGTVLGDPIEIAALTRAFRARTQNTGFCAIGSVKTNFGHLDEAAGVAGLIKTVLALEHKKIPPSLHFEQPNPKIDFAHSPFIVNATLSEWRTNGAPRRAGVSSFGIGGTNAHVVLEEAPQIPPSGKSRSSQLLVLSAKTSSALETATANLAEHLRRQSDLNLADVAYTLSKGRRSFSYRRTVVCSDIHEAVRALESNDPKRVFNNRREPEEGPITFMFSGQGTQYVNMGLELYQAEPTFREQVDRCCEILRPHLGFDLRRVLYPAEEQASEATRQLKRTAAAQPALFVTEYALARLWMAWEVRPQSMIGHSIGEYVAACLAGVFSLEDALALVAARGQLMQQLPRGAMLAVPLSEREVQPYLGKKLSLAAINGPNLCVVSGLDDAVAGLQNQLAEGGVECRLLETSHAFHSEMMDPILQPFTEQVKKVNLSPPQINYLSNLTGTWIKATEATDPGYWSRHVRQTVRFAEGLQNLFKEPKQILLEVGPGRALATSATRHRNKPTETAVLTSLRHPQDLQPDVEFLLTTLGKLWLAGARVDWSRFYMHEQRHRVSLPTYPFERQRYWIEPPTLRGNGQTIPTLPETTLPPRTANIADWFYIPSWKRSLPPARKLSATSARSCWLLFIDECGLGSQLVERLRQENQDIVVVSAGAQFTKVNHGVYKLNPGHPADYNALLDDLRALEKHPGTIVHLWTVTPNGEKEPALESVDRVTDLGFYSLLFLAQRLGAANFSDDLQIIVVSNNMQDVTGEESLRPEKALVIGPVRVIPKEYPNIRCRSIDVVIPDSGLSNDARLIDYLLAEFTSDSYPPIVAYRGHSRWEQSLEPVHLDEPPDICPRLRQGGVYVITGGMGSMGLAFAKYLAQKVRARLVLTGPTRLPPKDEWEKWLSSPENGSGLEDSLRPPPATAARATDIDLDKELAFVDDVEASIENTLAIKGLDAYEGLERRLNALCSSLICDYFLTSKIELRNGKTYSKAELKTLLSLLPKFEKFYDFFINALAEDEIIKIDDRDVEFLRVEEVPKPDLLKTEINDKYPDFQGLVHLLDHCAANYRKALTGEVEAITVLYPDGTSAFLDDLGNRTVEHANDRVYVLVLGQILSNIAKKRDGKPLKILEVGAGTGGLTGSVVESLADHDIEYYFTDIGRSFVVNAEVEASRRGIDYMKFGVLDISKDPAQQGYDAHSFDIILGYNVVHATPNLEATTRNLVKLLLPEGLLFLVETVKARRWIDMIWGLAEGWWYFDDRDLRNHSPLMSLENWEDLLRRQGLKSVTAYPRNQDKRRKTECGLIIAQRAPDVDDTKRLDRIPIRRRENEERIRERIRKLKEIEDLGSEVLAVTADVSDWKQMQSVISTVRDRFGDLHGVIHTAGTLGQGLIHARTRDEVETVLAPKVRGTCVIESLLRDTRLDFLILCSSLSSLFPIIGQIDYCAANAFLDAFARYKSHRNDSFTISIDWGFWQELGMIENATLAPDAKRGILEEIRNQGLANAGVEAFRYVLSSCTSSQIIVSPQDIRNSIELGRPSGEFQSTTTLKPAARGHGPTREGPEPLAGSISQSLEVTHPLFDACIAEGSTRKSYITHFSARKHWVVHEHRLSGKSILPGTAYLEMARGAIEHCAGDGPIEIREVYFLTPLIVEDDEEKEVRTVMTKQEDCYEFFIVSRAKRGQDQWQEHARGEITLLPSEPVRKRDLKAIESGFNGREFLQGQVTEFGPRWHNLKLVSFETDQGLALLELPDALAAEIGSYKLHPALLDIATGFMCIKDKFDHGLPFSYKKVSIRAPLPARIYSHVRHSKNHQPATPKFDVTIMDEEGIELVDVEEYTLREAGADSAPYRQSAGQDKDPLLLPENFNFCLEISSPGTLDTLKFRPIPRKKPNPGEVEIEVCATGLNFIEVLFALGLLPNPPGFRAKFGLECAGRIAAVGAGVEDFAVGDEVIAFSPACFSLFTTTSTSSIAHKPNHLTLEQAATIPAAFVTAYHALVNLGRLRQGERVLIHAATGGVGMAAVNIAQYIGAEIFATAGSEEKRAFLRALGITNVMDSRSLAFADEVMTRTDGKGVDVVLNSLGGEFISKSLSILAHYGRFLELGKRDIYKNTQLGLGLFEKHLSFFAIDVGTDLPDFGSVWREVLQHFYSGHFKPLAYRVFPITEVTEAFKFMAQARHIGKIVVSIENREALRRLVASEQSMGVPLLSIVGPHPELDTPEGAFQSRRVDDAVSSSRRSEITHQRPGLRIAYSAPRNETEQTLATVWQELLGIAQIGIYDDFFELRGDSLLAAQVVSRLNKAFQIKLPLSSLFDAPTVASLGERIEKIRWSAQELHTLPSTAAGSQEEEGEV